MFALLSGETGFRHEGDHIWPAECWETCQSLQSQPGGKESRHSTMCTHSHTDHTVYLLAKLQVWAFQFLFVVFRRRGRWRTVRSVLKLWNFNAPLEWIGTFFFICTKVMISSVITRFWSCGQKQIIRVTACLKGNSTDFTHQSLFTGYCISAIK